MDHLTISLVVAGLSFVAMAYSLYALFRAKKPASRMAAHAKMEGLALDLMGVVEPKVKQLLSTKPEELVVRLTEADGPNVRREAAIVARRPGRADETVVIDLRGHPNLEALLKVLRTGKQTIRLREASFVR